MNPCFITQSSNLIIFITCDVMYWLLSFHSSRHLDFYEVKMHWTKKDFKSIVPKCYLQRPRLLRKKAVLYLGFFKLITYLKQWSNFLLHWFKKKTNLIKRTLISPLSSRLISLLLPEIAHDWYNVKLISSFNFQNQYLKAQGFWTRQITMWFSFVELDDIISMQGSSWIFLICVATGYSSSGPQSQIICKIIKFDLN